MLRIDFITLFPEMVLEAARHSILKRAEESSLVSFGAINPRDFAEDAHRTVDDNPFGGGPGMVMKADVLGKAIDSLRTPESLVVLFEPWGQRFSQNTANTFSAAEHLILVCGHYEGIDARIEEHYRATVLSIGDFVLTGGELPALVVADAVTRQIPGVLGDHGSLDIDSHAEGLLTGPQYTRPWDWRGLTPPEILKSGNHEAVRKLKRKEALLRTRNARPDLFCCAPLTPEDLKLLQESDE